VIGGKKVTPTPLPQNAKVTWTRIEPTTANMSNTSSGEFRFELIDYKTTAIDSTAHWITADVRPTLTTDHGDGVGTMRYQVTVDGVASPGIAARRGRGAGGLADSVMRVSIRRDDTFLGFLTEMYGQPYIWASAGTSDKSHQSEHLEGSDCADLMVYAARRAGKKVSYTWTGGLPQVTKLLGAGLRDEKGVYRSGDGKPVPFTKPGDLVLFTRHVGALAEDKGTIGVLDDEDIIIHTLFDSPKEQAIKDTGYANTPAEVRRWRP
jgi:cell wall-associated NlpC family hydrolase